MLWKSSLKILKKVAVTIVLSAGVFVLVCATIKSVFLIVVCPARARRISHASTHDTNPHKLLVTRQRSTDSRGMGNPGNLCRCDHHQPPHGIQPLQSLARRPVWKRLPNVTKNIQNSLWWVPQHWWWRISESESRSPGPAKLESGHCQYDLQRERGKNCR